MEGVDQNGMHRTSYAFGPQVPRPPNQKLGIPPSHPNVNIPHSTPYAQFSGSSSQRLRSPGSSHSRSLSQPSIFSLDSLPPLSPSPATTSFYDSISTTDMSVEESLVSSQAPSNGGHVLQGGHRLPPRKGHRRSSSDSPLGISGFMQSSPPPLVPPRGESSGFEKPIQLVLKGSIKDEDRIDEAMNERKEEGADDLFSEFMNLDNIDNLNFSGMEDKDLDSRTSGSKTVESSDTEVESHANGKTSGSQGASSSWFEERREGIKRSSDGDIAPGARHRRSFSLDSSIGNFHIEDGSPKLPLLKNQVGQHSPSNSIDGKTSETTLDYGNGEFNVEELKKIMESDKLAEIAFSDPKRAKRILANRQSAARSKERKMLYITELEHKVQTLQTETTTLSTQFTKLQRDNTELKNENNQYKLRLQAMEQQSHLKDALKETLDAEVRRLRLAVAELGGESLTSCMARQLAINQLQHQQLGQQHRHFIPQNRHTHGETESQGNELHPQTQSQQIQRNELHPQP
ncbi:bZIP transcription factor 29-like [Gastrolobium bilobum]|uniref:bZIP transcription factor 29-like n=1 Tax=Gastrolobium bilobum TaxID=150636 RepID=UPI002AB1AC80|nr:bZIP transcription factor 29-like [Gastrolobium bilobum]XP_061350787.1 bZIP transcription factor 29-like [Gastrolobium bilobum]